MQNPRSFRLTLALVLATAAAGLALGQSVGPDVIVGDLSDLAHWGQSPDGSIQAYSVGTVSCNIGSTPLQWNGSTNQHPVIAQNLFRIANGRIEQVGQSWAKWAFLALNESFCGACQDPGTTALLGVNCSDPYVAGLNGGQSRLGPKSVVNPFTGFFPQNHPTPTGNGTIAGRLQVLTSDVDPNSNPSALYFTEGQYVTPDDAAAGNYRNNASYRQAWVAGNRDLTFSNPHGGLSSTVRTNPGILAWKAVNPSVGINEVDVPGDGTIFVGVLATDHGGGLWHYEIAIQNLNSDRAIGGVSIALPANANASLLGFHSTFYHSGEPYGSTPWASLASAAGVEWNTTPYANDPNANALRWGTLDNFWFDAHIGPQFVHTATLTLFKPGSPTTFDVALNEGVYRLGDMNCDGAVNFDDINPFVLALSDPAGYGTTYPNCPISNGDIDGNGAVDFFDINPFVALLSGS